MRADGRVGSKGKGSADATAGEKKETTEAR